ncbi:MAG TPA: hypothetical protein VL793_00350 [Patescibacteria group bacterium]|nr:hypothetical protein [Patescibacteria group bacterium]
MRNKEPEIHEYQHVQISAGHVHLQDTSPRGDRPEFWHNVCLGSTHVLESPVDDPFNFQM